MYLRFLKLDTRGADLGAVQEFYQSRVLSLLQQQSACRFASLLQATTSTEECISMTLWDSPEEADRYEQSTEYMSLLDEGATLVSDPAERKVRLSQASALDSQESRQSRAGDAFTIEAGDTELPDSDLPSHFYLKLVSVRVKPGRWDDLIDLYNTSVLPTLHSTRGCQAAFLVEALHDPDQALSVSIWDREEDAIRYELGGTFDNLTRKLRATLDGATGWKASAGAVGSATGPPARGYKQIVGQKL